jgi:uncharacterized iron-regulated membrane protein
MHKWLSLIAQLAPIILPVTGVPAALVPLVLHGMTIAEHISGATGAQKKAAALELIQTGATAANTAAGRTLVDVDSLTSVVSQGIDTTIASVNLVHNIPTA